MPGATRPISSFSFKTFKFYHVLSSFFFNSKISPDINAAIGTLLDEVSYIVLFIRASSAVMERLSLGTSIDMIG